MSEPTKLVVFTLLLSLLATVVLLADAVVAG